MTRKNLRETFQNIPSKSKKYAEKGNGISFQAFILSIFIYISIFYVFNLSPLALFNTTKFWFFISNTLILIITADFGDFSSSRKRDYYEEYVKNTHQARTDHIPSSSFEFQYLKMVEAKKSMDVIPKQKHAEHPREKIKDIIVYQKADESHEEMPETIVKDEPKNPNENQEDNKKLLQAVSESPKVDMRGMATLSPSKNWHPAAQNNPTEQTKIIFEKSFSLQFSTKKVNPISCFALNPSKVSNQPVNKEKEPPLIVVGSANADIYVEIDRLPKEGETVSAKTGQTLAGGKGANQAVCGGRLAYPTYFVGQIGDDAHGKLIAEALEDGGVHVDYLSTVSNAPTGHAVVMLQSDGQNSIIIVGGANMSCWPETLSEEYLEIVRNAGIVLLQREIPDSVNIQVAKAARSAGVPVVLDAGGVDAPIPPELVAVVDILSPNETELARLTNMPTENFEQISQAVRKCHEMGVKQVLVKLGAKGSALFTKGEEPIRQPIIPAPKVVDTTGAGDTFTAAYAVALAEGMSRPECLRFAAAAASLCVQVKGAIPSMPARKSVLQLLQNV